MFSLIQYHPIELGQSKYGIESKKNKLFLMFSFYKTKTFPQVNLFRLIVFLNTLNTKSLGLNLFQNGIIKYSYLVQIIFGNLNQYSGLGLNCFALYGKKEKSQFQMYLSIYYIEIPYISAPLDTTQLWLTLQIKQGRGTKKGPWGTPYATS